MNNSGLREKGFKRSLHLDTDKNHRDSEICSRIGQNFLHKSVLAVNSTYCQKDSTTASSYPETEQNSTSATREFLHGITHSKAKESSDEESKAVARLEWLGYPQELSRQWGFWSSFSFSFINLGGFWSYQTAYILGGPINLFWGTILAAIVMILQNLVLGELASAYPASGAMFTWAYKLAYSNPKIKDWASYFSWLVAIFLFTSQLLFQVSESWIFVFTFLNGKIMTGNFMA
ncbi:hypothetical protein BY996DRAFT_3973422 [Phakopsora pachyrhizi]|nr:hypothetical protein BY996DRAFT_3973422 [Phakopsora pachyrhizi]